MAINGYQNENVIGAEIPNWLSSEVGLTLKTYQLLSAGVNAGADGKKIVKSGTVFKVGGVVKGIVFTALTDVTNGDRAISVMVGGRVLENRFNPAIEQDDVTALKALGIVFDTAPTVTRV